MWGAYISSVIGVPEKAQALLLIFCRMCVSNCLKYCIINKNALFSPLHEILFSFHIVFIIVICAFFCAIIFRWTRYVKLCSYISKFHRTFESAFFQMWQLSFSCYMPTSPLRVILILCYTYVTTLLSFLPFIYCSDMNIAVVVLIQFTNQTCSGNIYVNM